MLELALIAELALAQVAPVETGALQAHLVHLLPILLAVGGEFLLLSLALGALLLQNLERLLRLSGRALLLRDAVLAPSLFELCPVVRLDLVPVRGRVRRAVLNDDVDDVEEVALVVQQLDGVGVGAFQLRVPRVLADDVGDGDVIACFEEVSARAVGVRLQSPVEPIEQGLLLGSLAHRLGGGGGGLLRCVLLSGIGLGLLLILLVFLIFLLLLGLLLGLDRGAHIAPPALPVSPAVEVCATRAG